MSFIKNYLNQFSQSELDKGYEEYRQAELQLLYKFAKLWSNFVPIKTNSSIDS